MIEQSILLHVQQSIYYTSSWRQSICNLILILYPIILGSTNHSSPDSRPSWSAWSCRRTAVPRRSWRGSRGGPPGCWWTGTAGARAVSTGVCNYTVWPTDVSGALLVGDDGQPRPLEVAAPVAALLHPPPPWQQGPPPAPVLNILQTGVRTSAVKRSIGSTIGFHNHGEGPY